jgi:osmotically-inducible protein OsmY
MGLAPKVEDVMYRDRSREHSQQQYRADPQERSEDEYPSQSGPTRSDQAGAPEQQGGTWNQRRSRGNWTGYVVPYRYYGNGYAGVGYYSVMYQGPEGEEEAPMQEQGQFDQRNVGYGQAQGAAWSGRAGSQRSSAGGYAGRGPKGYQRSDQRLREEVSDRLMADDLVDASDIEVQVKNGEVTLTGSVGDRQAKRRAEDLAEQVMGVRDVMNQIRVESGTSSGSSTASRRSSRNGSRSTDQPATTSGTTRADPSSASAGNS